MNPINKYLDLTDDQIDNLLLGIKLVPDSKEQLNSNKCISCGSDNLVIDNHKGYLVCNECAVINKECVDKNQEFNNDLNGTNRYGCPSNYFFPKSALGTKINSKGYNRISNLQRQGQMPYSEKSLLEVLEEEIQEKCKKYNISQTNIDSAKILYKKVNDYKHVKGKRKGQKMIMRCINRRSMIAACLFYACKLQKDMRSTDEIADIYDLEIKHVNRGCRKFLDYIDLSNIFNEIKISESLDFIERNAKKLNIEKQYIDKAKDISINIHKLDLASTHEPPSVAAGCLLLTSNLYNLGLNKKQISEIFNKSDVTISKTYRKIFPYHLIITDNKVTDMILEKKNNINKPNIIMSEESLIISDEKTTTTSEYSDSEYDDIEV
jgi:transcription initiation factor TFIIIB Brf1 subunit/transcription initiation factor TFIIB